MKNKRMILALLGFCAGVAFLALTGSSVGKAQTTLERGISSLLGRMGLALEAPWHLTAPEAQHPPSPSVIASCADARLLGPIAARIPQYWHPGTFAVIEPPHLDTADSFLRSWASRNLCAMGEGPLFLPEDGTRVRLLEMPSFGPSSSVRIERHGAEATLYAFELQERTDLRPGRVVRSKQRRLSQVEWRAIDRAVAEARLWSLPPRDGEAGLDGSECIIEIAEPTRYHAVSRWERQELGEIGELLKGLSGL